MDIPRFSVIVPTYHEETALESTLSSISQAGNGHGVETIVVDGGSSDSTLDVARKYTSNIHVIRKRGIGLARNHGARHARGDILVFLDSDTVVPEDFFSELSKIFQNPAVCGANCNVMPHDEALPTRAERNFYRIWGKTRGAVYRMKPCGTGDNGIIVRKDIFRRAGGFKEDMKTMEDLDFMFRASKHGRFMFLKDITLKESMRRIRRTGIVRFSAMYTYNFLYYLVKRKPRIARWEPVR